MTRCSATSSRTANIPPMALISRTARGGGAPGRGSFTLLPIHAAGRTPHTSPHVKTRPTRGVALQDVTLSSSVSSVLPRLTKDRSTSERGGHLLYVSVDSPTEQQDLDLLSRIVICDNASKDDPEPFLTQLEAKATARARLVGHHGCHPSDRRATLPPG